MADMADISVGREDPMAAACLCLLKVDAGLVGSGRGTGVPGGMGRCRCGICFPPSQIPESSGRTSPPSRHHLRQLRWSAHSQGDGLHRPDSSLENQRQCGNHKKNSGFDFVQRRWAPLKSSPEVQWRSTAC
ncbi:hypothetical protein SKAU_G00002600 [Synaphobranchus kaupii]|uniref:Uncharacterized protein n=1 Tax=Synaphobranchus kaupii TaxID=118154 RepID=A0A9Q1JCK4_SYNKA|nr:hypothetical protein SKAU_G00002600 [Synaphobranchus kaupii]